MKLSRAVLQAKVLGTLPKVVGLRVGVHRVEWHEVVEAEIKRWIIEQQREVFVSTSESICSEDVAWNRRMVIEGK